jgi:citrate synthase
MPKDALTITDQRTNQTLEFPVEMGTVRATELRRFKTNPDDFGLMTYDPAFMNTACCKSSITFIDGDKGILRYRGYDIDDLAENCTFLQVAYLLLFGELPTPEQEKQWKFEITHHTMIPESTKHFMNGFRYDAHPMGVLVSTVAALSTIYPEAKDVYHPASRHLQTVRLIAKMPTLAAYSYRHRMGFPYIHPDNDLSYTENFMQMLWRMVEPKFAVSPVLARALDILFILHADHEQNCSSTTMRVVGSAEADPYLSVASAASALSGPLHGGANEEVLRMLDEIGTLANVPAYIERVKKGEFKLMGFGHRVYKNYDPRARIIKEVAEQVFEVTGHNQKIEIALELERIALRDDYFVSRKLYPNVDFYSGIIYEAMGFQPEMFTVLFAIPRTVGWLAQWKELMEDPERKISRPRQIYTGIVHRKVHGDKGVATDSREVVGAKR